jgi:hypothetical protein
MLVGYVSDGSNNWYSCLIAGISYHQPPESAKTKAKHDLSMPGSPVTPSRLTPSTSGLTTSGSLMSNISSPASCVLSKLSEPSKSQRVSYCSLFPVYYDIYLGDILRMDRRPLIALSIDWCLVIVTVVSVTPSHQVHLMTCSGKKTQHSLLELIFTQYNILRW